ncbi:hypothetical protein [Actinomadura flavalba]|nr:hypothetical protein [Actinomadura flavalba]
METSEGPVARRRAPVRLAPVQSFLFAHTRLDVVYDCRRQR